MNQVALISDTTNKNIKETNKMFKQYYSKENWELRHNQDLYPYMVTTISSIKDKGCTVGDNLYFTLHDDSYVMFSTDWGELIELCTNENVIQVMACLKYFASVPMENNYAIIKIAAPLALKLLDSVSDFDMHTENFFIEDNFSKKEGINYITVGKDIIVEHADASDENDLPLVEIKSKDIIGNISRYDTKQIAGWLFNAVSDRLNLLNSADLKQYSELLSRLVDGLHYYGLNSTFNNSTKVFKCGINSLGKQLYMNGLNITEDSKLYIVPRLFYSYQDFILIIYNPKYSETEVAVHVTRMVENELAQSTVSYPLKRNSEAIEQITDLALGFAGVYKDEFNKFLYSPGFKIAEHYFTRESSKNISKLQSNAEFQKYFSPFKLPRINFEIVETINNIPVIQCASVDTVIDFIKEEYTRDSEKFQFHNTSIFGGVE